MRTEPRLHLDQRFTHRVDGTRSVVLVEDEDALLVDDALMSSVVRLLDGRRTAADIAEALDGVHPPAEVHFVLLELREHGVVHEGEPTPVARRPGRSAPTARSPSASPPCGPAARDRWWSFRPPRGEARAARSWCSPTTTCAPSWSRWRHRWPRRPAGRSCWSGSGRAVCGSAP